MCSKQTSKKTQLQLGHDCGASGHCQRGSYQCTVSGQIVFTKTKQKNRKCTLPPYWKKIEERANFSFLQVQLCTRTVCLLLGCPSDRSKRSRARKLLSPTHPFTSCQRSQDPSLHSSVAERNQICNLQEIPTTITTLPYLGTQWTFPPTPGLLNDVTNVLRLHGG